MISTEDWGLENEWGEKALCPGQNFADAEKWDLQAVYTIDQTSSSQLDVLW